MGIKCKRCGYSRTKVIYTESHDEYVKRRRKCKRCDFRFNTTERIWRISKEPVSKYTREQIEHDLRMAGSVAALASLYKLSKVRIYQILKEFNIDLPGKR